MNRKVIVLNFCVQFAYKSTCKTSYIYIAQLSFDNSFSQSLALIRHCVRHFSPPVYKTAFTVSPRNHISLCAKANVFGTLSYWLWQLCLSLPRMLQPVSYGKALAHFFLQITNAAYGCLKSINSVSHWLWEFCIIFKVYSRLVDAFSLPIILYFIEGKLFKLQKKYAIQQFLPLILYEITKNKYSNTTADQ